jgi:NAD(P)-dependent dehydrogenase (short-subunit alcohol dehydrogenase family)
VHATASPSRRLDGQVAVVTGAANGIGRGIVDRFVAEGARVCAVDVDAQRLAELGDAHGAAVITIAGDVAGLETNRAAVADAVAAFGRLDVVVPNAALFDGNLALLEIDADRLAAAFDEVMGVNVKAVLLAAHAAAPELARTNGSILITASFASMHPSGGGILYTTSKHAVAGIVKQLAYELAPDVRVNAIAPGVAPTRMTPAPALDSEPMDAVLPGTAGNLPLGRVPDASDYAGLYVTLASRADASTVTGSILEADSGLGIRGISRPAGAFAQKGTR